jgi:16S rRNA (cytidine1402-2'-O)-methyltransferase
VSDAGTPTVSDPGLYLIRQAIAAGLRVEPIPGANAAVAALSVSGLPNQAFTFLGFPPTKAAERRVWFERLRAVGHTVVFYESPHRITATLTQLKDALGDVGVVVARELTKAHEELVRGPISEILKSISTSRGEFTVLVDIGLSTKDGARQPIQAAELWAEFGEMTNNGEFTRRRAIATMARRHGMGTNEIYAALEEAKKLAV